MNVKLNINTIILPSSLFHSQMIVSHTLTTVYISIPLALLCMIIFFFLIRSKRHGESNQINKKKYKKYSVAQFNLTTYWFLFVHITNSTISFQQHLQQQQRKKEKKLEMKTHPKSLQVKTSSWKVQMVWKCIISNHMNWMPPIKSKKKLLFYTEQLRKCMWIC